MQDETGAVAQVSGQPAYGRWTPNELELANNALSMASNVVEEPEKVVARAEAYLAFLKKNKSG